MDILIRINSMLAEHIEGVTADEEKCREYFDHSPMIITAFIPSIGYDRAHALLSEFISSGRRNLREFLGEKLGEALVAETLSPYQLTSLGYRDHDQNP